MSAGSFITDHRSALKEPWGGWYLSGATGDRVHMHNAVAQVDRRAIVQIVRAKKRACPGIGGLVNSHRLGHRPLLQRLTGIMGFGEQLGTEL